MTLKNVLIAGLAATSMMLSTGFAVAQDSESEEQAQEATEGRVDVATEEGEQRSPEDNWLKVCDPLENGEKACILRQVVLQDGQFIGSFLLRDDPGQESRLLAVAAVPLGVLLPFGVTWQIDGGKPVRVPYMLCDPQSCASQLVINEAYVNSLKKGATLKLTAKNRQNKDLTINIDLSGFTATYESETALTFDEFRQESSGANQLQEALQNQAEQMRRQKSGEGGGTTGTPADGSGNDAESGTGSSEGESGSEGEASSQ